jgi:hypothetical protein
VEGIKERPVVVVVAVEKRNHGSQLLVVPVTTRRPLSGDAFVEIPLGLGSISGWARRVLGSSRTNITRRDFLSSDPGFRVPIKVLL